MQAKDLFERDNKSFSLFASFFLSQSTKTHGRELFYVMFFLGLINELVVLLCTSVQKHFTLKKTVVLLSVSLPMLFHIPR